jgi:hypothetical protein
MIRTLYRCLVWLHPPAFRREFGAEMKWIFDRARHERGPKTLLADACGSLARQWLLRTGWWKVAAAMALAVLQVTVGGLAMTMLGRHEVAQLAAPMAMFHAPLKHAPVTAEILVFGTAVLVGCLVLMVLVLVSSLNRITRRRRLCSNYAR